MAIVCGTDFSEDAKRASKAAVGLAGPAGDEVILVHGLVLPTVAFVAGEGMIMPPAVPPMSDTELREEIDERLAREAASLGPRVKPVLAIGPPETVLIEEAKRFGARLLVVGSHGATGAARWLLGSTADRLARSSPVPLLVVRGDADRFVEWSGKQRPLKVLVAVDFEGASDAVVSMALSLCRSGVCSLHFAHVFEQPSLALAAHGAHPATQMAELETLVSDEVTRLSERTNATPDQLHLLRGKPATELARLAAEEKFDLIVAGTHSRTGLDRLLLGSVAIGLLHRAPCPVLIAPLSGQPLQPTRDRSPKEVDEATSTLPS